MSEEQNKEVTADAAPAPVETPAAAPAAPATQAAAKVTRRRTPSVDKVAAEHQKVLAEALTKAAPVAAKKPAAKATKPAKVTKAAKPVAAEKPVKAKPAKAEKPVKPEKVAKAAKVEKPAKPAKEAKVAKPAKAEKPPKQRKPKLVRDSYAMPEAEYALIAELKKRLAALGSEVKKSELLRGGIAVLAALNDAELKAVMGRVERIKTGRPAKK